MVSEWPEGIAGAAELRMWYGGFPSFHDAEASVQLTENGALRLIVSGHSMSSRVDEQGRFILEKPFVATFLFEDLIEVHLTDFMPGKSILFEIDISKTVGAFDVHMESSYGFCGVISATKLSVSFEPIF